MIYRNRILLAIACLDWQNSYNYCCTVLQNNYIQYNPNLLSACLIIAKGYSNLDKHELEQIIFGKETIAHIEDMLNKQSSIYGYFFYDYPIERIIDFLKYEHVIKNLFQLDSLDDFLKAICGFFFNMHKFIQLIYH